MICVQDVGVEVSLHSRRISRNARSASLSDLQGFFNFLITTVSPDKASIAVATTENVEPVFGRQKGGDR